MHSGWRDWKIEYVSRYECNGLSDFDLTMSPIRFTGLSAAVTIIYGTVQ
jgi:hypothetical protein